MGGKSMRCDFEAEVVIDYDYDWGYNHTKIQCANEKGHVGDHLILIPS